MGASSERQQVSFLGIDDDEDDLNLPPENPTFDEARKAFFDEAKAKGEVQRIRSKYKVIRGGLKDDLQRWQRLEDYSRGVLLNYFKQPK